MYHVRVKGQEHQVKTATEVARMLLRDPQPLHVISYKKHTDEWAICRKEYSGILSCISKKYVKRDKKLIQRLKRAIRDVKKASLLQSS